MIAELLKKHQPSRWRSFTTDEEVLRCCGQDFGPKTRKQRTYQPSAYELWAEHVEATTRLELPTTFEALPVSAVRASTVSKEGT